MPPSRHRRRRADRRSTRRTPPVAPSGGFRNKWLLFAFGAIAVLFIVALLVPAVIPFNFGGGGGSAEGYVEGIGVEVEALEDRTHFAETATIDMVTNGEGYSTTPPTSGRHWNGWVSCGFYGPDQPMPDERIVHNLEHGNIVVSYNFSDPEQIAELEDAFDSIGKTNLWGVARYYDKIEEGTVYLTTWGVIDGPIQGVDRERMAQFFDAYSGTLSPEFPNRGADCTRGGVMDPA